MLMGMFRPLERGTGSHNQMIYSVFLGLPSGEDKASARRSTAAFPSGGDDPGQTTSMNLQGQSKTQNASRSHPA